MRHVSSTETSESSTFYSTCRISSTSSRTSSDRSRCLDISFSTTCTVFVPVCTQVCTVFVPVCTQNSFRARCTVFVPVCTQKIHSGPAALSLSLSAPKVCTVCTQKIHSGPAALSLSLSAPRKFIPGPMLHSLHPKSAQSAPRKFIPGPLLHSLHPNKFIPGPLHCLCPCLHPKSAQSAPRSKNEISRQRERFR